MRGRYTLYTPDGPISADNVITTRGRELIIRYMAGEIADWAGVVAVGVSDGSPDTSDIRLGYELGRGIIEVAESRVATNSVIVKGTIPQDVLGTIYEIGVFSTADEVTSALRPAPLSDFDVDALVTMNLTAETGVGRIGASSARLAVAAGATDAGSIMNLSFPMEGFDTADEIILAYHNYGNVTNVEVRMYTSDTEYFTYSFVPNSTGYLFHSWTKGDMASSGAASWITPIIRLEFVVTAATGADAAVSLDGMTVHTVREEPHYGLVSRAVLAMPQEKMFAGPMDVEYAIEFSW